MNFSTREEAITHTYSKDCLYFVEFSGEPIHGWACYTEAGDFIPKTQIKNFVNHYDAWMKLIPAGLI